MSVRRIEEHAKERVELVGGDVAGHGQHVGGVIRVLALVPECNQIFA
ncbi:hypothetical protein P7D22_14685 [Lichenihabitans sp. Uapishka_5]|nr:hypothetical protein [Lichenihabitans sp. Uapishka_5]MDX7952415.1 hypothetical protein [Lichenihabitans sp. Uapishka_5]